MYTFLILLLIATGWFWKVRYANNKKDPGKYPLSPFKYEPSAFDVLTVIVSILAAIAVITFIVVKLP